MMREVRWYSLQGVSARNLEHQEEKHWILLLEAFVNWQLLLGLKIKKIKDTDTTFMEFSSSPQPFQRKQTLRALSTTISFKDTVIKHT